MHITDPAVIAQPWDFVHVCAYVRKRFNKIENVCEHYRHYPR